MPGHGGATISLNRGRCSISVTLDAHSNGSCFEAGAVSGNDDTTTPETLELVTLDSGDTNKRPATTKPLSEPKSPELARHIRRARIAVALVFLTNGALFANLVPRFPSIKNNLGITNAVLGTALAGQPLGALSGGFFAPLLMRKATSARVAAYGIPVMAVAFVLAAIAPNWWLFAMALFLAGATDAIVDVAQNAHALRVQRVYGKSIVSACHGVWSIGAVLGGLMGTAATAAQIALLVHIATSGVLFTVIALVAKRGLLLGPDDAEHHPESSYGRQVHQRSYDTRSIQSLCSSSDVSGDDNDSLSKSEQNRTDESLSNTDPSNFSATSNDVEDGPSNLRQSDNDESLANLERYQSNNAQSTKDLPKPYQKPPYLSLVALSALAICGAVVEDAGSSWSTLFMVDVVLNVGRGAPRPTASAGTAFVALSAAMTVGRLLGDFFNDKFGSKNVARFGGALTVCGMSLALGFISIATAIVGFTLAGLGVSTLVPAAFHAADKLPNVRRGVGLTVVSTVLRAGVLLSPPLVGLVADASSLRVGLLSVVLSGVCTVLLSGFLLGKS